MAVNIDTNLFIDNYYKGVLAGNAAPSPYSAFVDSLAKGIDDQQKYESEEQQQAIRQNQIEQIPVANRIQEANALRLEADVAAYKNNPQDYAKLQEQKLRNELLKQQQEADMLQRKTEFINIIESKDPVAIGKAYSSGQYMDVLAADQNLSKEVTASSPNWADEDKAKLFADDVAKTVAVESARYGVKAQADADLTKKAYSTNGDIKAIADKLKISVEELALTAEIRNVPENIGGQPIYRLQKKDGKVVLDKNTNEPLQELDDNQQPIIESYLGGKPGFKKYIYYGKPGQPKEKVQEITDETGDIFNKHAVPLQYATGYGKGQGGMGDIHAQSEQVDNQKKQAALDQKKAAEEALRDNPDAEANFKAGLQTPPPAPAPTAKPLPPSMARAQAIQERQAKPVGETPAPEGTAYVNPVQAEPSKAPPKPEKSANPQAATSKKDADAKARADYAIKKQLQLSPNSVSEEAAQTTKPEFVPSRFEIKGGINPSIDIVNKVNSLENVSQMSALTKAIIAVESRGDPNAISPTGTRGLMQTTFATASDVRPGTKPEELFNPRTSLFIGLNRLGDLMDQFHNPLITLIGYNAGPAVAARAVKLAGSTDWDDIQRVLPEAVKHFYPNNPGKVTEVMQYVPKVLSYFSAFTSSRRDMDIAQDLKSRGALNFEV